MGTEHEERDPGHKFTLKWFAEGDKPVEDWRLCTLTEEELTRIR